VDLQCQSLVLYQFSTCPFCIKVRQEMHRLSLPIELRDSQNNSTHRSELLQSTGTTQVPCLKITDHNGQTQWLKESSAIVTYFRERFEASVF
jgi:glutathione S-transferase